MKEPCSHCGRSSCNGMDCYYEDEPELSVEEKLLALRHVALIPDEWNHRQAVNAFIGMRYEADELRVVGRELAEFKAWGQKMFEIGRKAREYTFIPLVCDPLFQEIVNPLKELTTKEQARHLGLEE